MDSLLHGSFYHWAKFQSVFTHSSGKFIPHHHLQPRVSKYISFFLDPAGFGCWSSGVRSSEGSYCKRMTPKPGMCWEKMTVCQWTSPAASIGGGGPDSSRIILRALGNSLTRQRSTDFPPFITCHQRSCDSSWTLHQKQEFKLYHGQLQRYFSPPTWQSSGKQKAEGDREVPLLSEPNRVHY